MQELSNELRRYKQPCCLRSRAVGFDTENKKMSMMEKRDDQAGTGAKRWKLFAWEMIYISIKGAGMINICMPPTQFRTWNVVKVRKEYFATRRIQ
jgi:hypothetical protein